MSQEEKNDFNFISTILNSVEELESPLPYWVWSGLCAISAVSKNLYLNRGDAYNLYPNIYVLLLGKSAIRKGPPVALARRLVKGVGNTRVIAGSATIQAIIEYCSKARTVEGGQMITDGSCFIASGEASNAIVDDDQAQTILVELYDTTYNDDWVRMTISGGEMVIKNPYMVMLGASAESHLQEFIQERSVEGGYMGRVMLVDQKKRNRLNSLTTKMKTPIPKERLIDYLKEVAKLKGEMTATDDANKVFDAWYGPYNEKIENGEIVDQTGIAGRMGDHVWKLAMLWSLSYRLSKVITAQDVKDAIRLCTELTTTANRTTLGKSDKNKKSESSNHLRMVTLEFIKQDDLILSRSRILQRLYPDINAYELDKVIETMSQSKWIEIDHVPGKEITYKLKDNIAAHFRQAFNRKKEE